MIFLNEKRTEIGVGGDERGGTTRPGECGCVEKTQSGNAVAGYGGGADKGRPGGKPDAAEQGDHAGGELAEGAPGDGTGGDCGLLEKCKMQNAKCKWQNAKLQHQGSDYRGAGGWEKYVYRGAWEASYSKRP